MQLKFASLKLSIYIYIYIYIERERERERERTEELAHMHAGIFIHNPLIIHLLDS